MGGTVERCDFGLAGFAVVDPHTFHSKIPNQPCTGGGGAWRDADEGRQVQRGVGCRPGSLALLHLIGMGRQQQEV